MLCLVHVDAHKDNSHALDGKSAAAKLGELIKSILRLFP